MLLVCLLLFFYFKQDWVRVICVGGDWNIRGVSKDYTNIASSECLKSLASRFMTEENLFKTFELIITKEEFKLGCFAGTMG